MQYPKRMLKLVVVIVACYALLVTAVYLMQGRMLYLPGVPGRTLTMTPTDAGLDYEDVSIQTSTPAARSSPTRRSTYSRSWWL